MRSAPEPITGLVEAVEENRAGERIARIAGAGQVMTIANPDGGPGNAKAKYRLGRMLPKMLSEGTLIEAATKQGYPPS